MLIIVNSRRPCYFKNKPGAQHEFDYLFNKKAWMNSNTFLDCLKCFDWCIVRNPGRKFALLLDNCTAHSRTGTVTDLEHVEIIFLPLNTISRIQPIDASIIAAIKRSIESGIQVELWTTLITILRICTNLIN